MHQINNELQVQDEALKKNNQSQITYKITRMTTQRETIGFNSMASPAPISGDGCVLLLFLGVEVVGEESPDGGGESSEEVLAS